MQPLHIDVVTDTYVPDVNGVAISLDRLCRGLRDQGHRVNIIRSGRSHSEWETTVWSWPLPGYWEVKVGAPLPGEILRLWKKKRPDVVYVAIETPLGFSAVAAARRLGIPVVGGFHTNFKEYLQKYGADWVGRQVWRYQQWFHGRLSRTLVPSPDARSKLEQAGFTKVDVLGRGVDTNLYNPGKRSAAVRKTFGAEGDTPIALVVGRVSSEKNIELAIRAFNRMRETCPTMICVVVGDGPSRSKLMKEHAGIQFPGYLLGDNLAACYASADILLFPSETETFGNVLIEGMASGVATLAYDYAAAQWHGENGVNLLKVEKGDDVGFIDAAVRLMDPVLRKRLSDGGLRTARRLSWPSVVAELEQIFYRVART